MRAKEFIVESVDPGTIFNQVKKIHHTFQDIEEGDLPDRIYWFDEYKKSELPLSQLDLNEFGFDEQLVDDYVTLIQSSPKTMPPIVYDPIAGSIIDGTHRANAYAKLGYDTIPAYVGLTKSDSYGERENEIDEMALPAWAKKGALAAGGAAALAAGGLAMHNKHQQFEPVTRFELPSSTTTQPKHQDPVKVLAHTMWGEARNQGVPGMLAIGNVIKNRAKDVAHERRFGKGIVGVATKPKQFSCWNPTDPNFKYAQEMEHLDKIIKSRKAPGGQDFNAWLKQFENTGKYLDYKLWAKSYELAKKIISGHAPDPTHGAVFYHTKDILPYWAKGTKKLAKVGDHIFYAMPKDIKESELDEYKVDNDIEGEGLGTTGYNANVNYRGLRVLMKPSVFLSLAAHLSSPTSVDYIVQHMENGGALGSPFLIIDIPEKYFDGDFTGLNYAKVVGHEGRNRMLAIQKVEGDEPCEVHIFGYGEIRARDFTPEIVEQLEVAMRNQDGKLVFAKPGQLLFEPIG